MKRIVLILTIITLLAGMFGACTNVNTPKTSPSPAITGTPGAATSPLVSPPVISPNLSPGVTGGAAGIPDFSEGFVVDPNEVPEIADAVKAKYPGATIQSITHATYLGEQVYKVILQNSGMANNEVYVRVDATIVEGNGASPAVSPGVSPATSPGKSPAVSPAATK